MGNACVGNNVDALLQERYPDISFLLNFTPYEKTFYTEDKGIARRDLSQVEVLYLYGIGAHFAALQEWLAEKKERLLIILEDDLGAIATCLESDHADALLQHPQVHLRFIPSSGVEDVFKELIATFPSEHIELVATESYAKRNRRKFQKMQMLLYRIAAVSHALMTEVLFGHKLLSNLLCNILKWPDSFFATGLRQQFKGIPAIICGAGPSLGKTFERLKHLNDRALIFAGGSTISALSNQGIIPHLGLAFDPNREEFDRLKASSGFEMPLIYASRLEPTVFNTCNGPSGYLLSQTGGPLETHFEKVMGIEGAPVGPELGMEAFSVTTIAIALAVEMGCDPIILNGIDLAYTGMERYAEGVMPSSHVFVDEIEKTKKASDRLLKKKDIYGHPVHTLVKWVMESECIADYAKQHPECRFLNATEGGLGFAGILNQPLSQIAEEYLHTSYDLSAMLHMHFNQLKMSISRDKIVQEMQDIQHSLIQLDRIAGEMLQELSRVKADKTLALPTGKMTILEIDFQEEKAFDCLFAPLGPALDRLLNRLFYLSPTLTEEERQQQTIERQIAKWSRIQEVVGLILTRMKYLQPG